jgi:hypothetical protein
VNHALVNGDFMPGPPSTVPQTRTRERDVEAYLRKRVKATGGECYKWVSPGRRNVPDRICMWPGGYIVFVEVKRPGGRPTEGQKRELQRIRDKGFHATWVANEASIEVMIHAYRGP